jgi:hypothetical protein
MIVVRNVFRIKFGKAKEAVELWKEGAAINERLGYAREKARLLTDVAGPFYTLVYESSHESLADWESTGRKAMADPDWRSWYAKVVPLLEDGHREIFRVVE